MLLPCAIRTDIVCITLYDTSNNAFILGTSANLKWAMCKEKIIIFILENLNSRAQKMFEHTWHFNYLCCVKWWSQKAVLKKNIYAHEWEGDLEGPGVV